LAPLTSAMADPSLHLDAIIKLDATCYQNQGESDDAYRERCKSLEAALGWLVFLHGVAGANREIAAAVCGVLVSASFGYCTEFVHHPEVLARLLDAAESVLVAMEQHPKDDCIIRDCVVFINNVSLGGAAAVEDLMALGAAELVAGAMAAHPHNVEVQIFGEGIMRRLHVV
jgi:hypothetical protein